MEVSSHSIVQERIAGLTFAGGIFTNITHEHLDYHGTFAEYIRAKKRFFDRLPKGAFALVNTDDRNGAVMVQNSAATTYTYALRSFSDFRCRILENTPEGMLLELDGQQVWTRFLGRFNAYNLAAVYGAARLLGADCDETLQALSTLTPVNGRFDTLHSPDGITAIVDYAHTPDALRNGDGYGERTPQRCGPAHRGRRLRRRPRPHQTARHGTNSRRRSRPGALHLRQSAP